MRIENPERFMFDEGRELDRLEMKISMISGEIDELKKKKQTERKRARLQELQKREQELERLLHFVQLEEKVITESLWR